MARSATAAIGRFLKWSRGRVIQMKPGDVLVLEIPGSMNDAMAQSISDHMTPLLPPGLKVMVLADGMRCRVLRPPKVGSAS